MKKKQWPTIGIIGGAGAMSSALLYRRLIEICQSYGCKKDSDFPEIFLTSVPFADMLSEDADDEIVLSQLETTITDLLVHNEAKVIGIACNTLHKYLEPGKWEMVINLPEAVKSYVANHEGFKRPLVLASKTSIKCNLYSRMNAIYSDQSKVIDSILEGNVTEKELEAVNKSIATITAEHPEVDGIIIGCTDLSLLAEKYNVDSLNLPVVDSLDVLAHALLNF